MIGWLVLGLVIGFAAGFGAAWLLLLQRRSVRATEQAAAPSLAPEPALAEPISGGDQRVDNRTDEEINQALDATKGLLDELEGRYRGRTAPAEDGAAPRARRRPRRPRA